MNKNILLASASPEKLTSLKSVLCGKVSTILVKEKLLSNKLQTLSAEVSRLKPAVLLLDFELLGLDSAYSAISLRQLCAETRVLVLSGNLSEDMEWELLKTGVRGYCRFASTPELLNQAVEAVCQGELWVPRNLTSRLIDELGNTASLKNDANRATLSLLSKLTQREYDIALRVSKGECNKQIAMACNITERTVKAHLTEIFHKMGVSDRLNLALLLATDSGIAAEYSHAAMRTNFTQPRQPMMRRLAI